MRDRSAVLSAERLSLRAGILLVLDLGCVEVVGWPLPDEAKVDFGRLSLVAAGAAVFTVCLSDAPRTSLLRSPAPSRGCSCRESRCDTLWSFRPDADRCLSPGSFSLERSRGRSGIVRSCSAFFDPATVITHIVLAQYQITAIKLYENT